ncbi:retrovirus-related pol polyprotein from transposon TNT 1-94 [Tanacetum coccineum]|uniref:Retrovirus-related pol polyprotein from transposon TNT 1-94 n=1 Tax=Tanacetum coccineum TaxID=301880 RepID=A0ABQ5HTA0_9ASTR
MMLKPTKLYDQDAATAIGVQNPFYLRKAKKAQPTFYDGDELLKTHHVPVIVTSFEEDLELSKTTRIKMNEKMNDPVCVEKRVKIIPPNYSKEKFMATFTPQTQLTPEQVFWSNEIKEKKVEDLKARTPTLPVLPPATVYPPNTPVHLVPRTLPTTSQVNIGLYNAIAIKSGEIERKNLLITNETLIANCIAQDVFYTVTNSVMNASRFHELSAAYNIAMNRVVDLEAENSKLLEKIQNDDHNTMVKNFSKLEIAHLNLQLKHQHLKENLENFKSKSSKDVPEFDAFFELGKRDDQIQGHKNTILYTKRSQELLENVSALCPKARNKRDNVITTIPLTRKKNVTFADPLETSGNNTTNHVKHPTVQKTNVPIIHSTRKPTGRLISLGGRCPLVRPTTLNRGTMPADLQGNNTPVEYNLVCSNQQDPNCCSKHMTGDRSRLRNFIKKFIGTVRFENDHFGAIMGYGDYVIGDSVISRVYYVEGLGHNLFSVGQFCDSDLKVAFRKHTCFVRDLDGVDLIKGSRGTNLYTISIEDMMRSSPIFLLSKASKNKSWLWHRRLNHLNFGTLNDLAHKDLVRGLPRLKFEKDHLCSACQLGKSKKATHKPKMVNTIMEVKFLRSKDETPEFVVKLLKQLQVGLNKTVRNVCTDNGTEFVNKDLTAYYESVGITHEKTVLRTPQQNGVVE